MRLIEHVLLGLAVAVAATGAPGPAAADPVSKFLDLYTAGKLREAAAILHCPETYTPTELRDDHAAVAGSLAIFVREFGQIKSVTASSSNLYVASVTACGNVPYWKKHPDTGTRTYETVNISGDKGYVIFSFADVDGVQVLSKFHQGLPVSPSAIARIKGVFKLQMAK